MTREKLLKVIDGEINYYLELYKTGLEVHDEECLCRTSLAKVDYIPHLLVRIGMITPEERETMFKKITEKKKRIMEEIKYGS